MLKIRFRVIRVRGVKMDKRALDCIRDVLKEREYQAVTKLLEEINDKSISEDSVGSYVKEIQQTLKTISCRKDMLTYALKALERYIESGQRDNIEFEESIKGSKLLNE